MHIYVDNISSPYAPTAWEEIAPYEPKNSQQQIESYLTAFAYEQESIADIFSIAKGALAPTTGPVAATGSDILITQTVVSNQASAKVQPVIHAQVEESEVRKISKQRVQLMAAAYARSVDSSEILARLEILNQRLLNKSPRVSKAQVDALEKANDQLAALRAQREQQAKRLGFSI